MQTYVRRINDFHFGLYSGDPKTHKSNELVKVLCTRRQAIRYAKKNGYDILIRGRIKEIMERDDDGLHQFCINGFYVEEMRYEYFCFVV